MTVFNPLPNIYVTNDLTINIQSLIDNKNNISAIITTSNETGSDVNAYIDKYGISLYNFKLDNGNIDFNGINQTIYQFLKNNKNVLIYEENPNISFAIVVSFYTLNISIPFFQFVHILSKKLEININNIDNNHIEQMFNFYLENHKS